MADFHIESKRPHLGGFVIGGDDLTFEEPMWRYLREHLQPISGIAAAAPRVVDLGCGEGHSTKWWRESGCFATGIDGVRTDALVANTNNNFIINDFSKTKVAICEPYHLCWCCEFVEHVEQRFMPNFLDVFRACKRVAMTHAAPGQPGHHHVNCQTEDYWVGAMAAIGHQLNEKHTNACRELAIGHGGRVLVFDKL